VPGIRIKEIPEPSEDDLRLCHGWGGSYPVIIGAGIDEQHDGKGIRISKGIGNDKPHIDLTWTQVEKRIAELIRLDRYLNPKEKELYPEWLSKQEERRREQQERNAVKEVLSIAPSEKENPAIRKYIAQRAELLGAIRLPNNTFGGNAGAKGVVSDILILQKRDRIMDIEPD